MWDKKYHRAFASAMERYTIRQHDEVLHRYKFVGYADNEAVKLLLLSQEMLCACSTLRGFHNPVVGSFIVSKHGTWDPYTLALLGVNDLLPEGPRGELFPVVKDAVETLNDYRLNYTYIIPKVISERLDHKLDHILTTHIGSMSAHTVGILRRVQSSVTDYRQSWNYDAQHILSSWVAQDVGFALFDSRIIAAVHPGLFDYYKTSPLAMANLIRAWGDAVLTISALHREQHAALLLLASLKSYHPQIYALVVQHMNERKQMMPSLSATLPDAVLPKTYEEAQYILQTLYTQSKGNRYATLVDLSREQSNALNHLAPEAVQVPVNYFGMTGWLVAVRPNGEVVRDLDSVGFDDVVTLMVEYYASVADKMRDKKTTTKLGRFLKKYACLDDELVRQTVEVLKNKYAPKSVTAIPDTNAQAWSYVYANNKVQSCMTNPEGKDVNAPGARKIQAYCVSSKVNDLRALADNTDLSINTTAANAAHYQEKADWLDKLASEAKRLALVVMHDGDNESLERDPEGWMEADIIARAVVNETDKTYNKIYGDTRLTRWLKSKGYRHDEGAMIGALLVAEEVNTYGPCLGDDVVSLLCTPYVDGAVIGEVLGWFTIPDKDTPFANKDHAELEDGHSRWFVIAVNPYVDDEEEFETGLLSLHATDHKSALRWRL